MSKRIFVSIFSILVALVVSDFTTTYAQTPVTVAPVVHGGAFAHTGVRAGDGFIVEIQADSVTNLASAQLDVTYDPLVLTFDSAIPGPSFDVTECLSASSDNGAGTTRLAFGCSIETAGTDVVLWQIVFDTIVPVSTTQTNIAIEPASLLLNDNTVGNPAEIPSTAVDATATVVVGVCGDQNNDASVNVIDVTIDLQIIVELLENPTVTQLVLSDLDRDGNVDVPDAILGLQSIVSQTPIDECGPPDALPDP